MRIGVDRNQLTGTHKKSDLVVCRTGGGLDSGACHERQRECDNSKLGSGGFTGKSICVQEYTAVFYDSDRAGAGRFPGG